MKNVFAQYFIQQSAAVDLTVEALVSATLTAEEVEFVVDAGIVAVCLTFGNI